ncbi:hypothetical protein [Pajaroellobacter abortibovis]|uniref:MalT-like TPR region domain-containing protein n=1 Tax=Pajaroellobacter abortibovis TaxID=1882918 RepID=A0A1L6MYT2_9BACT|nr:hypothetical protein [Pajaroellobacter abortibovis]APS00741.1 hypothetical protein BCY86_08665 [Pajaroellobacter abortibovis]
MSIHKENPESVRERQVFQETLLREAKGHPHFIKMALLLGELRAAHNYETPPGFSMPDHYTLKDLIWGIMCYLGPSTQKILEIVCLSVMPLTLREIVRITQLHEQDCVECIRRLKVAHFLVSKLTRHHESLFEPSHAQVREAVRLHMAPEVATAYHRDIALILENSELCVREPEALAFHWQEAGDKKKSAFYLLQAAKKAEQSFAFNRAVEFYHSYMRLTSPNSREAVVLLTRLGDVLTNAGRGKEAADTYRKVVVQLTEVPKIVELRRKIAEQLLWSGYMEEGAKELDSLLKLVGMDISRGTWKRLGFFLLHKVGWGYKYLNWIRKESQIPPSELAKMDICWSAAVGFSMVDGRRAAELQETHLLMALRWREPYRIARGLAIKAIDTAFGGVAAASETSFLLRKVEEIACKVEKRPYINGLLSLAKGIASFEIGQWEKSTLEVTAAREIFSKECTGVAWELDTCESFLFVALCYMGEYKRLSEGVLEAFKAATDRGDLYFSVQLRTTDMNIAWLVRDQSEEARKHAMHAIGQWSTGYYSLQHYYYLFAMANIDLYEGNGVTAHQRVESEWMALQHSGVLGVEAPRVEALFLRLRAVLAASEEVDHRKALLDSAEEVIQQLMQEKCWWAKPLAHFAQAAVFYQNDQRDDAVKMLQETSDICTQRDMKGYASAARWYLGWLSQGEEGVQKMESATQWLKNQSVRNPTRMISMLMPGFGIHQGM